MASRASLIQSRSIYVGTLNSVAPSDGNLIVTGDVGIGTTAPLYKLHVDDNNSYGGIFIEGDNAPGLSIRDNSGTSLSIIYVQSTAGSQGNLRISSDDNNTATTPTIEFLIGGSEKMRILDDGNVGIGTTAPAFTSGDGLEIQRSSATATLRLDSGVFATELRAYTDGTFLGQLSNSYLDLGTDNSTKVRITGAGNVGIGTTNPYALLHVSQASANTVVRIGNNTTYDQFIYFNGNNDWSLGMDYSNSNAFVLSNASSIGTNDRVVVTTGGNVGIGTTSPTGHQLDIASTQGSANNSAIRALYPAGGGLANTEFGALAYRGGVWTAVYGKQGSASSAGYFDGNVGIGTAAPSAKLEVYAGSNSTANTILWGQTIRNEGNAATTGYGAGLKLKNSSDSVPNELYKWAGVAAVAGATYSDRTDLAFYTNAGSSVDSTEKVRITGDGNLGIGTIAPGAPLSVAGVGGSTKGTNGYIVNIGGTDGDVDPVRYMIGFTHGNTYTAANVRAAVGMMVTTGGAGNLVFETGTSGAGQLERMRINGSGDVGINNSNPSYKLDVTGDVRITSGSLGVGVVPNATDGRIDASNDIVAFSTSDERFKENITPIANALDKVKTLTGVEFDWRKETKDYHGYVGHDVGVIAQQVKAVLPEAVRTNANGYLAVRYEKIIGLLVEAMKEQQAQIEELKSKLK